MSVIPSNLSQLISGSLSAANRKLLLEQSSVYARVEDFNFWLNSLTGIKVFFSTQTEYEEFRRSLALSDLNPSQGKEPEPEWGDFQTPSSLASQVCQYLAQSGVSPKVVIEPTYGLGNFILSALNTFPTVERVYGVEIQEKYAWQLKLTLLSRALLTKPFTANIELQQANIFQHRFPQDILKAQDILVIGNPPWVTNAELGSLAATNLPQKRNVKALQGLEAKTGRSNFDISEYILLELLELFSAQNGTLAMLCKNTIIKNIVELLPQRNFKISNIRALKINAQQEFDAMVEASLLVVDLGVASTSYSCQVATLDEPAKVSHTFGWLGNRFVSNLDLYTQIDLFDGKSPLVWRQGIKHDCAKVMELTSQGNNLTNGNGEKVEIEDQWVYWLLKSSDLQNFEINEARKKVIITQRRLSDDTNYLKNTDPRLWDYLNKHSHFLDNRKSSIYRGKPRFSIFGIGDYSFKPYKVAISGLYKKPCFSLISPLDNRPVLLDDTCYFLSFETYKDSLFTASILNSSLVQQLLQSLVFTDAKRPYTKEILMRIDIARVAEELSFNDLCLFWNSIGYIPQEVLKASDFEDYKQRLIQPHGVASSRSGEAQLNWDTLLTGS
jgi:hypothetical protein